MKNIFVFLLIIAVASSLNDQTYLTGFANQLGLSEDQISDNINCLSNAVSTIQNFKTTVTTSGLSISDTDILNWVQQIKLVLMEDCAVFEDDVKTYFSQNSLSPVFQEAICKNIITYNSKIKQGLVTWASTLNSNQDLQAGKSQAYIYQILFGVVNPTTDPIASFTFIISGMSVSFAGAASSDPDGTITNYKWNFGDTGSSSNTVSGSSAVSSHTYSSAATYTVTLIVTDNSGNTATTTGSVRINAKPTPSFTYSVSGKTITFDASGSRDSDGTVTNYAWTFGESSSGSNTASGTTSSASHTYAATGIYSVVLTVTDNDGATTTLTKSVRINTPPTASFTASVSGKTVTVDGSLSTDIDGGIMNYAWNFGESSSSSNTVSGYINSATHTYAAYGTYTVVLKVTDSDGAIGTLSKTVKVNSPPTASFTYTVSGNTISFNAGASLDSDGSIVTYAWNFGESSSGTNTASSSASTASHTYASPGTYTVTLTLTDNDGATTVLSKPAKINIPPVASFTQTSYGLTISFSGTGSTDSDGTIANYAWNFGESSSSSNTVSGSSSAVNHVYASYGTYTVSLKVTDNDGATNTVTKSVKVNSPPTASFTASVNKRVVTFNAGASTDSDGTVSSYAWDFGEPSSASNTASGSTATATHTYATAGGTFVVTLTVTDNNGGTGSTTKSVTVTPNSAPTASFTYTVSGNTIYFNAGTSTDSDGSIATYAWNFGDASSSSNTASSSSSTTYHTYTSTGTYMVTLTVTDNEGTSTTLSKTARINTPPTAIFSSIVFGTFVSFDASGSVDPDGTITTYAWNFGESSSSSNTASGSSSSATHTYATYGTFTVTLYATDNDGSTTTYSKSVRINTPPVASFSTSVTNRAVLVNAGSSYDPDGSLTNRVWDFGEPSSSSNTATGPTSTTHTYAPAGGSFTITLTVTDNDGATTTTTRVVTIAANVAPTASFSTVASTSGNQITFTSTGSDPDGSIASYAWNFGDPTSSSNTAASSSSSSTIHVYAESGTYSVTLTVTDNEGATKSVTTAVTVTTICDNKLHVIASWDHEGDYDLILLLPDGKYIGYWNQGPNSGTDYGKLIQDSHTMTVPEEQCWQNPNVPPSGTYLICVNPYSTSGGLPSIVTATVIINGVSTVFTKTEYFVVQDHSCSTTANSYVGSFTYP